MRRKAKVGAHLIIISRGQVDVAAVVQMQLERRAAILDYSAYRKKTRCTWAALQ